MGNLWSISCLGNGQDVSRLHAVAFTLYRFIQSSSRNFLASSTDGNYLKMIVENPARILVSSALIVDFEILFIGLVNYVFVN